MVAKLSSGSGPTIQMRLVASLPPGDGVLPEDFPERLERIKKASGLSWRQLAEKLGVETRQVSRWRKGVEPRGGAMLALIKFSMVLPEGPRLLFGDGRPHRKEW